MLNLLKSKVRTKLLVYYFTHPGAENYVRELSRIVSEDPSNILRELKKLERDGLFLSDVKGKEKYFKLNKNFPFYNEYKNIVSKTAGIERELKAALEKNKGIRAAFIYGSYASGKDKAGSDVDIFIIGKGVNTDEILEKINALEKKIKREINYRIFSSADFKRELRNRNSFILNIIKRKKIFLIGNEKDLGKFN